MTNYKMTYSQLNDAQYKKKRHANMPLFIDILKRLLLLSFGFSRIIDFQLPGFSQFRFHISHNTHGHIAVYFQ